VQSPAELSRTQGTVRTTARRKSVADFILVAGNLRAEEGDPWLPMRPRLENFDLLVWGGRGGGERIRALHFAVREDIKWCPFWGNLKNIDDRQASLAEGLFR